MRIVIGGDICPVNRYEALFASGDRNAILGPLVGVVDSAGLFVANLECPVTDQRTPIAKTGPALRVSVDCARGLKSLGLDAVGLANNHIMDQGPAGLSSTMEACAAARIRTFGAGATLADAQRTLRLESDGVTVTLLGMAEREWSLAGPLHPGANPLSLASFVRAARAARERADRLVVLLHAGAEGYPFPSPELREVCRFMCEEGADAVICQHSHCVGSYEEHQGSLIVYGQGNFVFDYPAQGTGARDGLLISLDLGPDGMRGRQFHVFTQSGERVGLRRLEPADEQEALEAFEARSRNLREPGFVEDAWRLHCEKHKWTYLERLQGLPLWLSRFNRTGRLSRLLLRRQAALIQTGIIQCETHREAVILLLNEYLAERR